MLDICTWCHYCQNTDKLFLDRSVLIEWSSSNIVQVWNCKQFACASSCSWASRLCVNTRGILKKNRFSFVLSNDINMRNMMNFRFLRMCLSCCANQANVFLRNRASLHLLESNKCTHTHTHTHTYTKRQAHTAINKNRTHWNQRKYKNQDTEA